MPSITPIMSAIFFADSLIEPIVPTTCATTAPPLRATSEADTAKEFAWRALSVFWRTAEVSSSRLDAVSSSDDACCSVRTDRSALPAEICAAATLTVSAEARTVAITPTMRSRNLLNAVAVRPTSSMRSTGMAADRSSEALTRSSVCSILPSPPLMVR
ncbi:hypothetical protein D3C72_1368290 [compost metagenome]